MFSVTAQGCRAIKKNDGGDAVSGLVLYLIISTEAEKKMVFQHPTNESESKSGPVGLLSSVIEAVREQIEADCIPEEYQPIAEEIGRIIAEVYVMPESWTVRIDGQPVPAPMLKDVYAQLTNEHTMAVMGRFAAVPYEIRHVKTYLRTALYNSVFETEARAANAYRKDHPYD